MTKKSKAKQKRGPDSVESTCTSTPTESTDESSVLLTNPDKQHKSSENGAIGGNQNNHNQLQYANDIIRKTAKGTSLPPPISQVECARSLEDEIDNYIVPKVIQVVSLANTTDRIDHIDDVGNAPVCIISNNVNAQDELNKTGDDTGVNTNNITKSKSRRLRKKNKASNISIAASTNNSLNNNNESHLLDKNHDEGLSTSLIRPSNFKSSINNNIQSSFKYSGNNIVLVSPSEDFCSMGSSSEAVPPSCIDNTSSASGIYDAFNDNGGDEGASVETSILGLDLETEYDENDLTQSAASWCLANQASTIEYEEFSPKITSIRSLARLGCGDAPPQRLSYQAASAFQIGPDHLSSNYVGNANTSRIKSSDSESSSMSDTVPAFATCSSMWGDELRYCEAPNCSNPAEKKCSQCRAVFYCCEEHQKSDWKIHKRFCTPYRIENVGEGSDGLPVSVPVASRNIPAGQVIFDENPLLILPLVESQSDQQFTHVMDLVCVRERIKNPQCGILCPANKPACLGCMRAVEFIGPPRLQCNKCELPVCAYQCQFLHPHLSGECEPISFFKSRKGEQEDEISSGSCHHTLYLDVEILRALQLEKVRHQWEALLEMKNNVRVEAYKKTERFRLFAQNIKLLVPYSAKMTGYNYDLIMDVHAIISSLSFRPSMSSTFKLLFSSQPLFAHDCVPNTIHYIEDEHTCDTQRMKLLTKAAVSILKGTMITIDFTPTPYLPYLRRRRILKDMLNISNCECNRCEKPGDILDMTAEINCPSCRCGTVYPTTPKNWQDSAWVCRSCDADISYSKIQDVENDCRRELASLIRNPKDTVVASIMNFIHRRGTLDLNPSHHIIITAWCYLESFLRLELKGFRNPCPLYVYSEAVLYKFEVLNWYTDAVGKHLDVIRPGIWIDRGVILFHKFYATFVKVSRDFQDKNIPRKVFIQQILKCLKVLQQALQILTVYEGYNTPSVSLLTQEATSALTSLKIYVQCLLINDENAPLPTLKQVMMGGSRSNN